MKPCLYLSASLVFLSSTAAIHADQVSLLGSAYTYAVLASSAVTNTGTTQIKGDLGLSPGTSITGGAAVSGGAIHLADASANAAMADALSAYTYLSALGSAHDLTGKDLGNSILTPGVYAFASSATLTGLLTFDFQGLSNTDIVIRTVSTLITANASQVAIINQGINNNVYYLVGSSATLGTYSTLQGLIIADKSITVATGANVTCGGLIALNGAVTLDSNNIQACSGSSETHSDPSVSPVPEPSSLALLATGVSIVAGVIRKRV